MIFTYCILIFLLLEIAKITKWWKKLNHTFRFIKQIYKIKKYYIYYIKIY